MGPSFHQSFGWVSTAALSQLVVLQHASIKSKKEVVTFKRSVCVLTAIAICRGKEDGAGAVALGSPLQAPEPNPLVHFCLLPWTKLNEFLLSALVYHKMSIIIVPGPQAHPRA